MFVIIAIIAFLVFIFILNYYEVTDQLKKSRTLLFNTANTILFLIIWLIKVALIKICVSVYSKGPHSSIVIYGTISTLFTTIFALRSIKQSSHWRNLFKLSNYEDVNQNKNYSENNSNTWLYEQLSKLNNLKERPTNIEKLSDDLRELNKLKDDGILTDEEFNEQKKKLLKQ